MFQFLQGAIKTVEANTVLQILCLFQFLQGAIKTTFGNA